MTHRTTPPQVGSREWLRWFRSQKPWRNLAKQVVTEEPTCWLRLPGCTLVTTTADHVIPASRCPELALVRHNVRGSCHHCNSSRSDKHHLDPRIHRPAPPSTGAVLRRRRRSSAPAIQFFNGPFVPKNGCPPSERMVP